jgi:thiol-disulfide isomerase/thioredoxin
LLDRLIRALLETGGPENSRTALEYARRFERDVTAMRVEAPQTHMAPGRWKEELDRMAARSLVLEARATGNIGDPAQAVTLAEKSWTTWPTAEAARERAWWLAKLARTQEAIESYADAFTLEDPRSTEIDRAQDRRRMGELYVRLNGSEKGLGDLILKAYDRTSALMNERVAAMRAGDPNASAKKVLDFTLPAVDGGPPLQLASLAGKIIVLDFWATWCEPCRIQHPMIDRTRKALGNDPNVVFISIDTDDDRSLVAPFMKEQHWSGSAYYEAGLMRLLNITSIPTVLVIDPQGQTSSRMVGFIPERFEDMLSARIAEVRKAATAASAAK